MTPINYKDLYFTQARIANAYRERLIQSERIVEELEIKSNRLQQIVNELKAALNEVADSKL